MKTREEIVELVRKCLALSKSSNEHEAALALAKAQEILFQHNLSMAEVNASSEFTKKSSITQTKVSVATPKNYGNWKPMLIHRIAQYNFCSIILSYNDTVYLIGDQLNIEVVTELFNWVVEQLMNMASEACKNYTGFERIPTFRRGFFDGAVVEISNRLYRNQEELKKQSTSSTALVVQSEALVKSYIAEKFGELKTGRASRGSGSNDGHWAGRAAGKQVDLSVRRKISAGPNQLLGRS